MGVRLSLHSNWSPESSSDLIYEFDQDRIVLGRGTGADVCIPHEAVSTTHATIQARGAGYAVQDEGSTNGTRVNGTRLAPNRPKPLKNGDRIELGGFAAVFAGGIAVASSTSSERTAALARRIVREMLDPSAAETGPPRLLVLNGAEEGTTLDLPSPPVRLLIGRGEDCDLTITDGDASREHAEVSRDLDGVIITDLDSKNGLLVNDRAVHERRLKDRDEIRIGNTVLVFEDPAEASVRHAASAADMEMTPPSSPAQATNDGAGATTQASGAATDDGTVDDGGADGEATPARPPHEAAVRAMPRGRGLGADWVIYLLAAAVLTLSIAGFVVLLGAE